MADNGPTEETPLIHPDELETQKAKAAQAKVNLPVNVLLLAVLLTVLLLSKAHPGISADEDKQCQPLIIWLTVYTAMTAAGLLVSLAFVWYCCYDFSRCTEILLSLGQLGVFIWGLVVVLTTPIGTCDQLLFWTVAILVFIGPLFTCCCILVFAGFAAGFGAAAMMKEEKGPEATPDLAKAAEDAKVVKGNVMADCPVCQQRKLVKFASPCGHMLCEDCIDQMQTMEDKELGVRKCPTCRQPVHFFQGVWTAEQPLEEAPL